MFSLTNFCKFKQVLILMAATCSKKVGREAYNSEKMIQYPVSLYFDGPF